MGSSKPLHCSEQPSVRERYYRRQDRVGDRPTNNYVDLERVGPKDCVCDRNREERAGPADRVLGRAAAGRHTHDKDRDAGSYGCDRTHSENHHSLAGRIVTGAYERRNLGNYHRQESETCRRYCESMSYDVGIGVLEKYCGR